LRVIFGANCIQELADLVKDMPQYYALANGKASMFKSSNDIYTAIITSFVEFSNNLLTIMDMQIWHHILTDLVRYKYNTEIITITVSNGFHMKTYQDAIRSIANDISIAFIINDENGVNPIISLDYKEFIKNNKYNAIYDAAICKPFFVISDRPVMDLSFITSFAEHKKYRITELFINLKNLCYGVIINDMFIPILASSIPYKNAVPLNYNVRPEAKISRQDMKDFIDEINKYKHDSITIECDLIYKDRAIGLMSSDLLCYYHLSTSSTSNELNRVIDYDPRDIDQAILQRNENNELSKQALLKKYYNNIYKLFFSEFSTIIQKDKNVSMRKKMLQIIEDTDFMNSKSIQTMIDSLNNLLKKYPNDLLTVHHFIEFIYFNSIDIPEVSRFINISKFEFDLKIIEELRSLEPEHITKRLHEIMDPYIVIADVNVPQRYNIYTSCINDSSQFFCKDSKMIVPQDLVNGLFDVLTNDIMNKSKIYSMLIGSSGIFDYIEFIERPHEFIEMSDIKDIL
jgi:hypothetical protein